MSTMSEEIQIGDANNPKIREGMHNLIAAVIGDAIKPDKTRRLANGRVNRPEDRGGETKAWLSTTSGEYWLKLADLTGVLNSKVIVAIAQDDDNGNRVGKYIERDAAVQ